MMVLFASASEAGTFQILPNFSIVMFRAPYFEGFTLGTFSSFQGKMEIDEAQRSLTGLTAEIDLRSVNTMNFQRNLDLQGPDLFDTKSFPNAQFSSKRIEGNKVIGDLTLKGKTKEVTFEYQLADVFQDKAGRTIAGLTLQGEINRKDFGIIYNRILEKNKPLMADQVKVEAEVAGLKLQ